MVSTTDYIWHRDAVRVEFDDIGIVKASYTRQPDGFSRIISQDRGGQKRFHSFDALGSTSELTDTSSSATDTFRYSAFGNEVERTGETVTPHTWIGRAGYQKDGLDRFYVRRRYFYVDQSSWLSVDPLQALVVLAFPPSSSQTVVVDFLASPPHSQSQPLHSCALQTNVNCWNTYRLKGDFNPNFLTSDAGTVTLVLSLECH